MVLVLQCTRIRCEHKFGVNAAPVRQCNRKLKLSQVLGVTILKI